PLSTLSVLFQNMKINNEMGTLTAKEAEETVTQGLKLTQIMEKTVDDFRNFFKVDKERSDFTVQSCLEDVMLILGAALQKAGILVNNNIYETVKVQGLKNEFTQVLLNIINNAKDALIETNPATKKIDIDTSIVDDRVRICITDTAGGIPKEHMDKIFESHFTTKEDKEGTGIGLHMSKTIIETDMHGSIKAENTTQGARFIIELPILTN
ncbi:MAG: HAMP domain-containing histidine kinase, partial [Thiovulaceae bacterium]|nr:HAMP domain-containing histidine kinase [Sulfurimonadaceae bacterium]